jgi:hypothetical protein
MRWVGPPKESTLTLCEDLLRDKHMLQVAAQRTVVIVVLRHPRDAPRHASHAACTVPSTHATPHPASARHGPATDEPAAVRRWPQRRWHAAGRGWRVPGSRPLGAPHGAYALRRWLAAHILALEERVGPHGRRRRRSVRRHLALVERTHSARPHCLALRLRPIRHLTVTLGSASRPAYTECAIRHVLMQVLKGRKAPAPRADLVVTRTQPLDTISRSIAFSYGNTTCTGHLASGTGVQRQLAVREG